jgi:large subunit ribosomal protein L32
MARSTRRTSHLLYLYFSAKLLSMVVRMRHTRAHTRNRRSHHALVAPRLSRCENCGDQKMRHRICLGCGTYRREPLIDVAGRQAKRQAKSKEKAKAKGEAGKKR